MDQPKEPWFQLTVGQHGTPSYAYSDAHTRVQRQFLYHISWYSSPREIDEFEQELDAALGGAKGSGVTQGGDNGFWFNGPDGKAEVWFEYDDELKGAARYLSEPQGLLLPMSEAEPLFRAWIASVRHWRALEAKHGVPLPADKWPTVYPPPAAN
jgi:hypothetical protein